MKIDEKTVKRVLIAVAKVILAAALASLDSVNADADADSAA